MKNWLLLENHLHLFLDILLKIPFDKCKFRVITYEHDYYNESRFNNSYEYLYKIVLWYIKSNEEKNKILDNLLIYNNDY